MLEEVEAMRQDFKSDVVDRLVFEAEGHVLSTLLAWGTTKTLKDHIKLFEYQANLDESSIDTVSRATENLRYRFEQSAAGYLDTSCIQSSDSQNFIVSPFTLDSVDSHSVDSHDSLYVVDDLFSEFSKRLSVINLTTYNESNVKRSNLSANLKDTLMRTVK